MAGNAVRGLDGLDKKVGGEWVRACNASYPKTKLVRTRGGIIKRYFFTVSRPHTREGHTLQNLTNFTNIFVFGPLNLVFPPKCNGNRFPIA